MAHKSHRLLLGKIATAHGVRGLVKLMVLAEDTQLLNGPLHTAREGGKAITLRLKNSLGSKGGKFWLAEVEGVADRNEAEKLRGTELWLDRDRLPETASPDEFYVEDLKGLKVQDAAGALIGTVLGLDNFGAGDLLDIQPASGESFYLPFTDETILKVDTGTGCITVEIPEGLGND